MKHDSTPKTAHLAIYIHIIAWVLLFTFPLLMEDHSEGIRWNEYFRRLSIPVSFFIIFYANYWLLVPKFLLKKNGHATCSTMFCSLLCYWYSSICSISLIFRIVSLGKIQRLSHLSAFTIHLVGLFSSKTVSCTSSWQDWARSSA